jgi:hypothetical protein
LVAIVSGMVTTRLSEQRRSELVARFEQGVSTVELARAFDCSTTTVTRAARAVLGDEAYEAIKQRRARRSPERTSEAAPASRVVPARVSKAAEGSSAAADQDGPQAAGRSTPAASAKDKTTDTRRAKAAPIRRSAAVPSPEAAGSDGDDELENDDGPCSLAIDDADDFSGNDDEDEDEDGDDEDGLDEEDRLEGVDGSAFIPIAPAQLVDDHARRQPAPLAAAPLTSSAYLLVDKTVELQARPLRDFPELGRLPEGEEERQALALFINPRQAKRQCGRSQRVIKLPDPTLLVRTAPYLLAQGISRVVVEGTIYALPGS